MEQRPRRHYISIHALREEGDSSELGFLSLRSRFLSTPSARRATRATSTPSSRTSNFYPRPPRGGRHRNGHRHHQKLEISIHALREEGDLAKFDEKTGLFEFLSTPSARRATRKKAFANDIEMISIHALREEGDKFPSASKRLPTNFYPRPPRGGRHPDDLDVTAT